MGRWCGLEMGRGGGGGGGPRHFEGSGARALELMWGGVAVVHLALPFALENFDLSKANFLSFPGRPTCFSLGLTSQQSSSFRAKVGVWQSHTLVARLAKSSGSPANPFIHCASKQPQHTQLGPSGLRLAVLFCVLVLTVRPHEGPLGCRL